ncbi:MAG TPA: amidase [Gemmataceae bacterium]|jgi:Asp-tRNA(Asn)/Glu-tRNA(Gln) amidotransferase A subunit family amidase|nr:amidase [Gemmataceae bacterium]
MKPLSPTRRQILKSLAATGLGTAVFQRALAADTEQAGAITAEMIQQAEWVAGISLPEEARKKLIQSLTQTVKDIRALRKVEIAYDVPPALVFDPAPWESDSRETRSIGRRAVEPISAAAPKKPESAEDLAFLPVTSLSALIRARQVSSVELTKLYLERLKKYDPVLKCVVTLMEDLAVKQAEQADREIAAGRHRGPLHGIPWGAKDLIAYPGYKTTWGAGHFQEQTLEGKATVARRLEEAGAVLVAKTTLGALAMGDKWFGGMTRNPWDPKEGSSGSSAGSSAATAAGLIAFGIGSETLGSIVSPCTRCGATGLRPTFGRVSRAGCMTLSWSMDKLGPIARSVEDCALIFAAIHGTDGQDPAAVDRPFAWPPPRDLRSLRVGYVEGRRPVEERTELKILRDLGVQLVSIKLPDKVPVGPLRLILNTEAATSFDDITRQGVSEGLGLWPETFREKRFVAAVDYLRANRVRTLLMRAMDEVMRTVDLYVGGNQSELLITNLTGHPTVVLPNGTRKTQNDLESPTAITFTGRLYGETELLAVAHAFQQAVGQNLKRPTAYLAPGQ